MGAGTSVPSSEGIRKQTRSASDLTKLILNWMLEKSNLADLYALAAPSECRKYIVATAESLPKLFKEIKLLPRKDSSGKIFFQQIADFRQIPVEIMESQRTLCLELSFFFIRILQIFAALTLSVIDSEMPSSDYLLEQDETKVAKRPLRYDEFYQIPGFTQRAQRGGALRGGALRVGQPGYIRDENYSILNRYLTRDYSNNFELTVNERSTGIYINGDTLIPRLEPVLTYESRDENDKRVKIRARLRIERQRGQSTETYRVTLSPITKNGEPARSYSENQITRELGRIGPVLFKSILGDDPAYNNQTIPKFILNEFKRLLGKRVDASEVEGKRKMRKFTEIPYGEIPPPLQLKKLWDGLTQNPPVKAYCVSRALQLLNPNAIYGDLSQEARTSICDMKFATKMRGSIPTQGKSILDAKGLMALNLLFFDFLQKTMPSMAEDTKKKYAPFLDDLRAVYEEQTSIQKSELVDIEKAGADIQDKVPTAFCGDAKGVLLTKEKSVIKGLRTYVSTLLTRQMTHTAAVTKLLGKLFVISDDVPSLHPLVQERGMVRVEELATEARELLSSYYQDCEIVYRQGVVFAAENKAAFKVDGVPSPIV
jgi:hypothetical protein